MRVVDGLRRRAALCTGALVLAASGAGCSSPGAVGVEQRHVSCYLSRDGGRAPSEAVDAISGVVSSELSPEAEGKIPAALVRDLSRLLERALESARSRAVDLFGDSRPEIPRALEALNASDIQLVWAEDDIDREHVMEKASYTDGMSGPADAPWMDHDKRFHARIQVAAAPWPRKPGYTDHPEIVVAHSSVAWSSAEPGAFLLASALAETLSAHVVERVEVAAPALGLVASTEPVPRS